MTLTVVATTLLLVSGVLVGAVPAAAAASTPVAQIVDALPAQCVRDIPVDAIDDDVSDDSSATASPHSSSPSPTSSVSTDMSPAAVPGSSATPDAGPSVPQPVTSSPGEQQPAARLGLVTEDSGSGAGDATPVEATPSAPPASAAPSDAASSTVSASPSTMAEVEPAGLAVACPAPVTGVVATAGMNAVVLSWSLVDGDVDAGVADVTSVFVVTSTVNEPDRIERIDAPVTETTVTGLKNGVTYAFTVYAATVDGRSVAEGPVEAMPTTGADGEVAGLIVAFTDGTNVTVGQAEVPGAERVDAVGLEVTGQVTDDAMLVELSEAVSVEQAEQIATDLQTSPDVAWAEPDVFLFTASADVPSPADADGAEQPDAPNLAAPVSVPADWAYASDQWSLWDRYGIGVGDGAGAMTNAWASGRGAGAVVAVIDTGITNHPDLADRLVPGWDFVSNPEGLAADRDGTGVPVDFDGDYVDAARFGGLGRDGNPTDPGDWRAVAPVRNSSWHGTAIAGVIAASDNSAGVVGVAPEASIEPVRALSWRGGLLSDIAASITWASGGQVTDAPTNGYPADVINMSFAVQAPCPVALQQAVTDARARGTVLVAAAGNAGMDAGLFAPGNCDGVLTIAATNRDGQRAGYSNYGARIDLSAPGGENTTGTILAPSNTGTNSPDADGATYRAQIGTSVAAAHVSGAVALLKARNTTLTPDEIEQTLTGSVREFGTGGFDTDPAKTGGTGILNLGDALAQTAAAGDTDYIGVFNGSSQYGLATGYVIPTALPFTAQAWVYAADPNIGVREFLSQGEWTKSAFYLGEIWGNIRAGDSWNDTGVPLPKGRWVHIALSATSAGQATLYVDGNVAATKASGFSAPTTPGRQFQIGRQYNDGEFWKGSIDEVRVYSTARTQAQIATDMRTYGPTNATGLIAYYDFNEGSGTSLTNRKTGASASTDLTLSGGPTWAEPTQVSTSSSETVVAFQRSYLTATGGWQVPAGVESIGYLTVAGGGGGGAGIGGGGGAGGVLSGSAPVASGARLTVTVGPGGVAGANDANGGNGHSSVIAGLGASGQTTVTATGGGGGGGWSKAGVAGGSGGGGAGSTGTQYAAGSGAAGQGKAGGKSVATNAGCPANVKSCTGGGGGGAGTAGSDGTSTQGGTGGTGASGASVGNIVTAAQATALGVGHVSAGVAYFAGGGGGGGGGGGVGSNLVPATAGGIGGLGGGGNGHNTNGTPAGSGTANTGGGGGGNDGGTGPGGAGGSGVVLVRYQVVPDAPTALTATPNAGGTVTLTWTAPSYAGTSTLTGYTVLLGTASGSVTTAVTAGTCTSAATSTATTCTVSGLTSGTTYYFTVAARNSSGAGSASSEAQALVLSGQTITFTAPTGVKYADSVTLSATASSGLSVALTSNSASICTVSGFTLSAIAPGDCSITASQAGDTTYSPATDVTRVFAIGKASQATLSLTSATSAAFGSTIALTTSGGSGTGTVSFAVTSPTGAGLCAVSGLTLTLGDAGSLCTVQATRSGDVSYDPATSSVVSVTTSRAGVTLAFASPAPSGVVAGDTYTPTVTATSAVTGLAAGVAPTVAVGSGSGSVCSSSGGIVTFVAIGACVIEASTPQTTSYLAATTVTQTVHVGAVAQAIAFMQPADATEGDGPITLSATASSGLVVDFTLGVGTTNAACAVTTQGVVTIAGVGICEVVASQSGNTQYAAAPDVTRSFVVHPAQQPAGVSGDAFPPLPVRPLPVVPVVPADGGVVTVDGEPETVAFVRNATDSGWQANGIGFGVTVAAESTDGGPSRLSSDGILHVGTQGSLVLDGVGYRPFTSVTVFAIPVTTAKRTARAATGADAAVVVATDVDALGRFGHRVALDGRIAAGRYLLQVNGYSAMGQVRTVSMLMEVAAAPVPSVLSSRSAAFFQPRSATFTIAGRARLVALADSIPANATDVRVDIVGVSVSLDSTFANLRLAAERADEVVALLSERGVGGTFSVVLQTQGAIAPKAAPTVTARAGTSEVDIAADPVVSVAGKPLTTVAVTFTVLGERQRL